MNSHPEQKPDEVFLTNATVEEFRRIGWHTKRPGRTAYMTDGTALPSSTMPVFVKRSEISSRIKTTTGVVARRSLRLLLQKNPPEKPLD